MAPVVATDRASGRDAARCAVPASPPTSARLVEPCIRALTNIKPGTAKRRQPARLFEVWRRPHRRSADTRKVDSAYRRIRIHRSPDGDRPVSSPHGCRTVSRLIRVEAADLRSYSCLRPGRASTRSRQYRWPWRLLSRIPYQHRSNDRHDGSAPRSGQLMSHPIPGFVDADQMRRRERCAPWHRFGAGERTLRSDAGPGLSGCRCAQPHGMPFAPGWQRGHSRAGYAVSCLQRLDPGQGRSVRP